MSVISAPPTTNPPTPPPAPTPMMRRRRRGVVTISVVAAAALIAAMTGGVLLVGSAAAPKTATPGPPKTRLPKTLAQSLTELEAATARRPDDPRNWQQLAQGYVQRSIQTLDPAYYPLAQKALARATELAPDDPATVVASASLAVTQHQFATAHDLATRAIELNPDGPQAYSILVDANVELGRYDEAEITLQQLLNRRPGAAPLARVSYLRELHGDLPGALEAMREAEGAASGDSAFERATYITLHGDVLLNVGRGADAEPLFKQALALVPSLPLAVIGTARVAAIHGDTARAITLLTNLVAHAPVPAAATLLGDLQQLDGRTTDAAASFDLVRALIKLQQAGGVDADLDLSLFESDHGAPTDDAVARARRAFADRPSVYGADALAWTLYRSGRVTEARPVLDSSLRLGSKDPLLLYHAAAILDASGDTAGATTQLQQVADLNPWFSFSLRAEAMILAKKLAITWPVSS